MSIGLLKLVGANEDDGRFARYLEADDPCFGRHFAKSATECQVCLCPVVLDGRLLLLREVCQARCAGTNAGSIKRLTSQQILESLTKGATPTDLWLDILNGSDPGEFGAEARLLLADRLWYLANHRGVSKITVPKLKELRSVHDQQDDRT